MFYSEPVAMSLDLDSDRFGSDCRDAPAEHEARGDAGRGRGRGLQRALHRLGGSAAGGRRGGRRRAHSAARRRPREALTMSFALHFGGTEKLLPVPIPRAVSAAAAPHIPIRVLRLQMRILKWSPDFFTSTLPRVVLETGAFFECHFDSAR